MQQRKSVKEQVEEARQMLFKATKILSEIVEGEGNPDSDLVAWQRDRVELWCRVFNEGGVVTKERLHGIWKGKMRKDVRGLGGFFVGKGASLAWTPDDKAVLTKKASESIRTWTGKEISEYAKKYKD